MRAVLSLLAIWETPFTEDMPSIFLVFPYSIIIHEVMAYRTWQYGNGLDYVWGKARSRGITTVVYPIDK